MTDHTTAERAAFEDWMNTGELDLTPDLEWDENHYCEFDTQRAWRGWLARAALSAPALPMAPLTGPEALLISRVFAQFRHDACLAGDDRISESFIKAAGALVGARAISDELRHEAGEWLTELARAHVYLDVGKPFFSGKDCSELAGLIMALMIATQSEPATRAAPVAIDDVVHMARQQWQHQWTYTAEQIAERFAAPTPDAERHVANHAGELVIPEGCALVKVSAQGVQFGNAWYSHEKITGYTAEQLNEGNCRVTGRAYMQWLAAPAQPTDKVPT